MMIARTTPTSITKRRRESKVLQVALSEGIH